MRARNIHDLGGRVNAKCWESAWRAGIGQNARRWSGRARIWLRDGLNIEQAPCRRSPSGALLRHGNHGRRARGPRPRRGNRKRRRPAAPRQRSGGPGARRRGCSGVPACLRAVEGAGAALQPGPRVHGPGRLPQRPHAPRGVSYRGIGGVASQGAERPGTHRTRARCRCWRS